MSKWYDRLPGIFLAVFVILVLFVFVLPFIDIQLRLSRNGAIAAQLVESLHIKFPLANFSGTPSYEREVIYIQVGKDLDREWHPEVEQWLRKLKEEKKIKADIWIWPPDSDHTVKEAIKL